MLVGLCFFWQDSVILSELKVAKGTVMMAAKKIPVSNA
jgi:hypothetical protein